MTAMILATHYLLVLVIKILSHRWRKRQSEK